MIINYVTLCEVPAN